jgi:hypothetical protein
MQLYTVYFIWKLLYVFRVVIPDKINCVTLHLVGYILECSFNISKPGLFAAPYVSICYGLLVSQYSDLIILNFLIFDLVYVLTIISFHLLLLVLYRY